MCPTYSASISEAVESGNIPSGGVSYSHTGDSVGIYLVL